MATLCFFASREFEFPVSDQSVPSRGQRGYEVGEFGVPGDAVEVGALWWRRRLLAVGGGGDGDGAGARPRGDAGHQRARGAHIVNLSTVAVRGCRHDSEWKRLNW